ncbi:MAG: SH3 domain-containing protein [Bacteroidales bacterium]|nr:SH3 domain-containing protein [Bacteroidales bacterium]
MSVLIGHASIDENGKAHSGSAGDQTKREVCTRNWYNKSWDVVIRPKDATMAEKMAKACEQACANDKIGYDQYQRNTLYTQAQKVSFDLSKITTACECDCSSLMCVCAIAGGISPGLLYIGGNMRVTSNMRSAFKNTGKFEILTDAKYLTSDEYLKRGDIIVNEGSHTVMVLSNGSKASSNNSSATTQNKIEANNSFVGKGIGTATAATTMNVRTGAGTSHSVLTTIPVGTKVEVLEVTSNKWYKIVWPGASCGYAYVSNANNKYFTYKANSTSTTSGTYMVRITASALNVRASASTGSKVNTVVHKNEVYTIVEEKNGWGKLKSGAGWISLKYTKKV